MHTSIAFAHLLLSAAVAAQQPVVPQASVAQDAPQQPVVRHVLAVTGEPVRPAKGWALTPGDAVDAEVPGVVSTHGPGVRITAATDITLFRPSWSLAGEFAVGALFQSPESPAAHGLTLGGARGMAFLVRADGTFAVQPLGGGEASGGSWSPVALRASIDGAPAPNRLEVRVGPTEATFLVNGQVVSVVRIAAGQLDGTPGVHVAAQGDVAVAAFTVETAAPALNPSAVKVAR